MSSLSRLICLFQKTVSASPSFAYSKNILRRKDFCKYSKKTMSSSKLVAADRTKGVEKNVWVEFGQLAVQHKALNIGQGFPDFAAPDYVTNGLSAATLSQNVLLNQYTRGFGHERLVQAFSKLFSKIIGRPLDPHKELLVTVGAYESLFCAIMGNINPGDEVIIIEPFYDCYVPMVALAGGKSVFIPLRSTKSGAMTSSGDWVLDKDELASKFNSKTKAIIINTPNNPLGKVYKKSELEYIAELAKKHDTLVIMDEVYEWLVYKGYEHVRMATLPGMWERTITIGSAGKTFSVTGWKCGWTYGPANLIRNLQIIHQNAVYCCPTPIQEAVGAGFELEMSRFGTPECYFNELPAQLEPKRDKMAAFLQELGMDVIVPEGGYFMVADYSKLGKMVDFDDGSNESKDVKFVKWLTREKKLAGIPPSAFYADEHKHLADKYIRFCFIKEDSTLDKAEAIIKDIKKSLEVKGKM